RWNFQRKNLIKSRKTRVFRLRRKKKSLRHRHPRRPPRNPPRSPPRNPPRSPPRNPQRSPPRNPTKRSLRKSHPLLRRSPAIKARATAERAVLAMQKQAAAGIHCVLISGLLNISELVQ